MSGDLQPDEPETFQPETTTGLPAANAATVAEADSAGRVVRILILEDEALGAELAQRLLVRAGLNFSVVVVDTKASFIEQLAAFRPEVILADYRLPDFSGREALKIAQEENPDIPFIFWSGVLADEAAVELIKQGATDYVLKDRPARLPTVILRALAEVERRARLAQLKDQLQQAQRRARLRSHGGPSRRRRLSWRHLSPLEPDVRGDGCRRAAAGGLRGHRGASLGGGRLQRNRHHRSG